MKWADAPVGSERNSLKWPQQWERGLQLLQGLAPGFSMQWYTLDFRLNIDLGSVSGG